MTFNCDNKYIKNWFKWIYLNCDYVSGQYWIESKFLMPTINNKITNNHQQLIFLLLILSTNLILTSTSSIERNDLLINPSTLIPPITTTIKSDYIDLSPPTTMITSKTSVTTIKTNNKSLEIDYCDLTFINDEDRIKAFQDYLIINETSIVNYNDKKTGKNLINELISNQHDFNHTGRLKRSLNKIYTIETAIFVDSSLAQRYEGNLGDLQRLIMSIMNEVQLIYEYSSMETQIQIVITKLEILSNQGPDDASGDIDQYLDNFCLWQAKLHRAENWSQRWDHALMLTGLDLYKATGGGKKNKKVLGLAWVNGMCKPTYSCTLNEGKSFEASFVIAHEMGHSLGILHDGRGNNCDPDKFIMSEKTGPGKVNWSPCSNVYVTNFLSRGHGRCLENVAMPTAELDFRRAGRLPGEQFPPNIQCQLALGAQYKAYISSKEPFSNICRELWCLSGSWATPAHPALEGSQCGPIDKRCYQGSCSSIKTHRPTPNVQMGDSTMNRFTTSLSQFGSLSSGQMIPNVGSRPSTLTALRRWNRNRTGFRPLRVKSNLLPNSYANLANLPNRQQLPSVTYTNRQQFIRSSSDTQRTIINKSSSQLLIAQSKSKSVQTNDTKKMIPPRIDNNSKKLNNSKLLQLIDTKLKQSSSIQSDQNNLWMETIRSQLKSITDGAKSFFSSLFNG